MPRSFRPGRAALVLVVGLLTAAPARAQSPGTTITTAGTGRVTLTPSAAEVTVAVGVRDSSAASASVQTDRRLQQVLRRLRAQPSVDSVRVVRVRVDPKEDDENRITGYEAEAVVLVRVRQLARLGEVLDAALRAGATGVGPIQFRADSVAQGRVRALKMAYEMAHAEAEALAAAAGKRLGRPLTITTSPAYGFAANGLEEASVSTGAASAEFGNAGSGFVSLAPAPADVVVSRTVQIAWALGD